MIERVIITDPFYIHRNVAVTRPCFNVQRHKAHLFIQKLYYGERDDKTKVRHKEDIYTTDGDQKLQIVSLP